MKINDLDTITDDVIEGARSTLVTLFSPAQAQLGPLLNIGGSAVGLTRRALPSGED
jgi:hypothetical protein